LFPLGLSSSTSNEADMTQLDSPKLVVRLDSGPDANRVLQGIEEYSVDSAYMTSTDAFSFKMYERDLRWIRNLELQRVDISIDGNPILKGRIEITEIGGNTGTSITCQGRDYIADLIECHVDPAVALNDQMTLEQAIKIAAGPVGIDTVSYDAARWRNFRVGQTVETTVGTQSFQNAPLKDYKANPGEGIYEFLNRLCVRFGCTLQPTAERNTLLLDAPDYVQETSYFVRRTLEYPNSATNDILSASVRRDYSKFPTVVLVSGKSGGASEDRTTVAAKNQSSGHLILAKLVLGPMVDLVLGDSTETQTESVDADVSSVAGAATPVDNIQKTIEELVPPGMSIFVERIAPRSGFVPKFAMYRLMYMRDNLAKDVKQVQNIAARKAAERFKDCLQYTLTVRGHRDPVTNRMYTPNTVIGVYDELCDIEERLWVEKCTYTYSPGEGAKTQLVCWRPGSFGIGVDQ